jgi:hypothetical protein
LTLRAHFIPKPFLAGFIKLLLLYIQRMLELFLENESAKSLGRNRNFMLIRDDYFAGQKSQGLMLRFRCSWLLTITGYAKRTFEGCH